MISTMNAKTTIALIAVLMLGSCSSSYHLRTIITNGEVTFIPDNHDMWGNPNPDCFYSISVSIVDGPPAVPGSGDSTGMVQNGVYWRKDFVVTTCENAFPVTYGAKLQGPPFRENNQSQVEAKPLLPGYTYEVSAASEGSAYGGGKFKLTEQGTVENLPI